MFGKHKKLGQTGINFHDDCKITLLTRKTISGFILPSNDLHLSHTLSKLLTRTPHKHHWYSPISVVIELHPLPHAKRKSTLSLTPVQAPPTVRQVPPIHPRWVSSTIWVHFIPTTSPHLQSTLYFSPTTSPHLTSPPIHPLFESDDVTLPPIHTPLTHPLQKPIHISSNPSSQNPLSNP